MRIIDLHVTFCKTVVQYHNQDIDSLEPTNHIQISSILHVLICLYVCFMCLVLYSFFHV